MGNLYNNNIKFISPQQAANKIDSDNYGNYKQTDTDQCNSPIIIIKFV